MRDASSVDTSTIDAAPCPNGVTGTYLPGCFTASQPIALGGELLTDSDSRCQVITQTTGPAVCAIVATSITTTADLRVRGARALALVATSTIDITHDIDAASHRKGPFAGTTGPAANHSTCAPPNGVIAGEASGNDGGAGGAGGSFGARGGDGGNGGDQGGSPASGGVSAIASAPPAFLRGGCPGGNGGDGAQGMGGLGGEGGGAVYLLANGNITFHSGGTLNASGAGGRATVSGGGGGGSGGMIALESKTMLVVQSGSAIWAVGGGGAGGNSTNDGGDATMTTNYRGPGGLSGTAGEGGLGLDIDGLAGNTASLGGGGGGGGGGIIDVVGTRMGPGPIVPIPI